MKKILSHGSIKVYRAKCSCDCEFEYQSSDVEFNREAMLPYVVCPECGTHIRHSECSVTTTRMTTESL